jgi:serine/threonine protein phosphatase PrpC
VTTLRSGSATDVGKVRTTNQDVALEEPGLFAVADGMGGHAGGEVAARVAVDSLRAAFQRAPTVEGLRRAVAEANRAVWRQGQSESGLRGMGTTLTATALVEEADGRRVIVLANVGDSRAYVYSKGQVIQVTADHSLAEEKVRQGQLTEAEAAVHPHRHVLTRALGVSSDVDVDLWKLHLHDGDRILLCSDGLTNEVGDERIGQVLGALRDPSDAAKGLVKAALDHGGSDNVTCVVIDVAGSESPPAVAAGEASAADHEPAASAAAEARGPGGGGQEGVEEEMAGAGLAGEGGAPEATGEVAPNGARAAGPPRALRVLSGTGSGVRSPDGRETKGAGGAKARGTTAIVAVGNRDVVSGAAGWNAENGEAGGGPRQGSGNALASTRLQVAELRRLRPTRNDRRSRRRAPGTQRLVTMRLVLFVVLLLAVVAAAYAALRWYAMDEWYVGIDHGHLAVYQGRPGGLLWFKPRLVDDTPVTTHEVMGYRVTQLRADHEVASLAAAKTYVQNLRDEYLSAGSPSAGSTTPVQPAKPANSAHAARAHTGGATSTSTSTGTLPATVGAWQ